MSFLKKLSLLVAIAIVAVLCVLIYWGQHLYYKAEKIGDNVKRIEVLEKAIRYFPLNDLVFYELGKAYLDLRMSSLGEQSRSSIHLQKSTNYFSHSLRLNPTSYFAHFYLAQSLHNMDFSSPFLEATAFEHFKRAAYLAGENAEIYYEIARVFFPRWKALSPEDRDFTQEILKKVVNKKDRERLRTLFHIWEINVKDYELMDKILSEDAQIFRDYADFLGEKSLSLEERHKYLAKAEYLDFQRARAIFEAGEYAIFYYRIIEALDHFKTCLNILNRIHFYQNLLTSQELIDLSEYSRLKKLNMLNLAKAYLEQGQDLKDVNNYLWEYLESENDKAAFVDLESYLIRKGLIGGRENPSYNDLDRLSLELFLSFRQGKFDDNISKGRDLPERIVSIPEGKEAQYVKILGVVGEALQKVDFIYDSNDFYNLALERDPDNLEILAKLHKNFERLGSAAKKQEIDKRIEEIISPRDINVGRTIYRGQRFRHKMILAGQGVILGLHFNRSPDERDPLIAIMFNGKVMWENYLAGTEVSIAVESKNGENMIEVVPVNREVELMKITYE